MLTICLKVNSLITTNKFATLMKNFRLRVIIASVFVYKNIIHRCPKSNQINKLNRQQRVLECWQQKMLYAIRWS